MALLSPRTRILPNLIVPQRRRPDPRHATPPADRDLTGQTVVFTGGTDGIGREAAGMLYGMGADLGVLGRSEAKGPAVVRELDATGGRGTATFEYAGVSGAYVAEDEVRPYHPKARVAAGRERVRRISGRALAPLARRARGLRRAPLHRDVPR